MNNCDAFRGNEFGGNILGLIATELQMASTFCRMRGLCPIALSVAVATSLGLQIAVADSVSAAEVTAEAVDIDADGLEDAYEAELGTDPTLADTDGDGLVDGVETTVGTDPLVADNPSPNLPVAGASLHLQANLGVELDANGQVWDWHDLSGNWNDALQTTESQMPLWQSSSIGAQPALLFDGNDDMLLLPDLMNGAGEGELFVVARLDDLSSRFNGLCQFGTGDATAYSYGLGWLWDDFGTDAMGPEASPGDLLARPHVLNSTVTADGESVLRFNGQEHLRRSGLTVGFRADPMLGTDIYGEWYSGVIAEVVVYDRVLSEDERASVESYLEGKYSIQNSADTTDSDDDGLYDWIEAVLGTDPSVADTDGDGLLDGVEVTIGTDPCTSDNPGGSLPLSGIQLHLRADLGVGYDASGAVSCWHDVSGNGNDAMQSDGSQMPTYQVDGFNGCPAIHFDGVDDDLVLPDLMNGAGEGELLVVARLADQTDRINGICHFGTGEATGYSYVGGWVWDDFGTAAVGPVGGLNMDLLLVPHLLGSSISAAGVSVLRFNGVELGRREDQSVSFRSDPLLGSDYFGEWLDGDIAEVLVFDHVLTQDERDIAYSYLDAKYGIGLGSLDGVPPGPPGSLSCSSIAAYAASVAWSAAVDNFSVPSYQVYCDGELVGETSTLSFDLPNLLPSTVYRVAVRAVDAAGNVSSESAELVFATAADVTPPTAVTELVADSAADLSLTLTWTSSVDDGFRLVYEVFCDGVLLGTTTDLSYVITGLDAGVTYRIAVRTRDAAGNVSDMSEGLFATNSDGGDVTVDSDGDGMPDEWEIAHGLDPLVDDASQISTDDGLSNLEKYLLGCDPEQSAQYDATVTKLVVYIPI